MTRIDLNTSIKEMFVKMAGGNPGALTVCLEMFKQEKSIDPDSLLAPIAAILSLDQLNIYEHRIWLLYKDVCSQDMVKTLGLLRANQLGFLSSAQLNHAIDNSGNGVDVNDMLKKVKKRLPEFGKILEPVKEN